MADELLYNRKIQLFQDVENSKILFSFVLSADHSDSAEAGLSIVQDAFVDISVAVLNKYEGVCEHLEKDPEFDFIKSQLEEMKVDFTYWLRGHCKE